jgi:hypothetical protein
MKPVAVLAIALALVTAGVARGGAQKEQIVKLSATLTPTPAAKAQGLISGTGTFNAILSLTKKTITWTVHVDGMSGPPVAEHIHLLFGEAVLIPICDPCESTTTGKMAFLLPSTIAKLRAKQSVYVQVHTDKVFLGEISGTIRVVK